MFALMDLMSLTIWLYSDGVRPGTILDNSWQLISLLLRINFCKVMLKRLSLSEILLDLIASSGREMMFLLSLMSMLRLAAACIILLV